MYKEPDLVKVYYAQAKKSTFIRLDYHKKTNDFCTLRLNEGGFTINGKDYTLDIEDYSEYTPEMLFQEMFVCSYDISIDIETLQKYQRILKDVMNNYPCEIGIRNGFNSIMIEVQ